MREKCALYLLIISLLLIIGIDITPYTLGETKPVLGYLESIVDGAVVVLTYLIMKRELNFRTKVLHMAAHDLRNPLGVIRGYSELLLEKSTPPEMEREMILKIHSKSDEILQLVGDLLDTATLERRQVKLEREETSLTALVEKVIADFDEQVRRKNQRIQLEPGGDVCVYTDSSRMRQVFANLLSNAIKYSPVGSELVVTVGRAKDNGRITVKDRGPGLSKAEKDLIFDSFTRVKKPTTGGESSTGLGLSISKSLVELNGGKIWAESQGLGKGSTFVVELPVFNQHVRK